MKVLTLLVAMFVTGCVTTENRSRDEVTRFKPGLSESRKELRTTFLGKWLSRQPTEDGGLREAVIERFNDSKYIIEFRFYDSYGKLSRTKKEFGIWGVSGGIYFTIYRGWIEGSQFYPSDPSDAYNYDSYRILEVSEEQLTYLSLSSGNRFTYQRVE